jgi:ribosomal protein L11 methyltransferase
VRVPDSEVEVATAWLLDRFPDGLEERAVGGAVELAVFTDDAGEAAVSDSFSDVTSELVAAGWEYRWKEFHRPVRAGGLWIGPPWMSPPADELSIIVDPGRAFGTGAHPTTRACIELLAGVERGSLLDAGCGSGVVSVAAARLGFAPVVAVDLDEVAVEVAALTARANDVEIDVHRGDALHDALPRTDVLVANIELGVVEQLLGRTSPTVALTSGYLDTETPQAPGWVGIDRLELDGWAADVFVKPH